jgi:hypothetical protein
MGVDKVHVLKVETLQARIHTLDDVLARKALVVDRVISESSAPVDLNKLISCALRAVKLCATYLGGNHQVVALPAILLNSLAHNNLRLASSVRLGTVKEVDTALVRSLHTLKSALCM